MCFLLNIKMSLYWADQMMGYNFHNGQGLFSGFIFIYSLFYLLSLTYSYHSFNLLFCFWKNIEVILFLKKFHFALNPT